MFITNNLGIFAELPFFFPKSQSLIEPIFTGEYSTAKSLRFRRSNSSSLSRTPSVNGVRKSWTWSGWIKRGTLGVQQYLYSAFNGSTNECAIRFNADNTLEIEQQNTLSTYDYRIITRQVFRDPAAWFHLVVAVDTTQLLDSSRIRVFVNGLEIEDYSTTIYPTRNFDTNFNSTLHTHQIGAWNTSNFFDGYLSDINFIDGESVLPTEFGMINYTIGVWVPKKYTGLYGLNGFYLPFLNNSNVPALGLDTKNSNPELIVNGTFDTDITGWTVASNITGTPSITWQSTKRARITNAGNSLASAYYQAIPTVIGQTYYAHVYIHAASIGGTTRTISLIKTDGTATNSANAVTLASTTQASVPAGLRGSFVATSTTTYIFVLADILGTGATGADVSQISVSLSDYKNNFTCNNISLAPGSNFDSMTDTPTLCSYASYYSGWNPNYGLQFRSTASTYLTRTPSASNRRTWTWSGWIKRGIVKSTSQVFFGARDSGTTIYGYMRFDENDKLSISLPSFPSMANNYRITNNKFTDSSVWYHICFVCDSTLTLPTDRIKVYVNNVLQSCTEVNANQNDENGFNAAIPHSIGRYGASSSDYFDGYLAEINFIDGLALTPSSFAETDSNGRWVPKAYTGSYGTNGFYLNFADRSAMTDITIGNDASPNTNNFQPNNMAITDAIKYSDITSTGNYATLNAVTPSPNVSQANLSYTFTSSNAAVFSTLDIPPNMINCYFEVTISSIGSGVAGYDVNQVGGMFDDVSFAYSHDGRFINNTTQTNIYTGLATFGVGDIIGVAVSPTRTRWYKNNSLIITHDTTITRYMKPYAVVGGGYTSGGSGVFNFGQRPFAYTPRLLPGGGTTFTTLNTNNLPTPIIEIPSYYMATTTYTGIGESKSIDNTVNDISVSPDLVWIKSRNRTGSHHLFDSVRGSSLALFTDGTTGENSRPNSFTSFNSTGFTVGNSSDGNTNLINTEYVSWQWMKNVKSGFDIVTWNSFGNNNVTVNHSLSAVPAMIIAKHRSGSGNNPNWYVYHKNLAAGNVLSLNSPNPQSSNASLFTSVGSASFVSNMNAISDPFIAYCFAEVEGYSKFGSYTGNGLDDGPFVFCGFRPRFVMIKRTTDVAANWATTDSSRSSINAGDQWIIPNLSDTEYNGTLGANIDIISNGFKLRIAGGTGFNATNATYIFAAFAETPNKYALAEKSVNIDKAPENIATNSLRFRSSASTYLNRTPSTAGNRKTWTWSGWVKRGLISGSATYELFFGDNYSTSFTGIRFTNDSIRIQDFLSGSKNILWDTSAVFRDPSAWYHIVVKYDTTQASSTNSVLVYVNGVSQTLTFTILQGSYVQNYDGIVNSTNSHKIGAVSTLNYFDGYMTEINFVDGLALSPIAFGEIDSVTGVWTPRRYTGSYGTNGFYLKFGNTASLGEDSSGKGNNWTPNNFNVTKNSINSTFTTVGTTTWTAPAGVTSINYLIVAGGGGGGASDSNGTKAAGGGGGGVITGTIPVTAGNVYNITVGGGGAAAATTSGGAGTNGQNSSFSTLTAIGGGGGGGASSGQGKTGGSGGGSANGFTGGLGTTGQGFNGGVGIAGTLGGGGGGGGAGGAGESINGGVGKQVSIGGVTAYYGGGGGGRSGASPYPSGTGGTGGGGSFGSSATPNTGGGGGGGAGGGSGTGGSGIVILSYDYGSSSNYDVTTDVPVNYNDNGNGRGNYCTLNPLDGITSSTVLSRDGNLVAYSTSSTGTYNSRRCSIGMSTGKWYMEFQVVSRSDTSRTGAGLYAFNDPLNTYAGNTSTSWAYIGNGFAYTNATNTPIDTGTYAVGDTVMMAFDADAGKLWFGKNNVWHGNPSAGTGNTYSNITSGPYFFGAYAYNTSDVTALNFGQRPFNYTPPTGFKALNTNNLPTPTIINPSQYMAATTYTGTGSAQRVRNTVNNVSFQPDLVWLKSRGSADSHGLFDSVRGAGQRLQSNDTTLESFRPDVMTSFNTNGFSISGSDNQSNASGSTYVAWQWKSGNTIATNTSGSITSQVNANPTAGVSIVTYTGNGITGATIGHGLGVVPSMIIVKSRNEAKAGGAWTTWHKSLNNTNTLYLDQNFASTTYLNRFDPTGFTSSVFKTGSNGGTNSELNTLNNTLVAYCFAEIAGFSKFGSYTGNGSADGPFVFCGFRPRFVMIKRFDSSNNWHIFDSGRSINNGSTSALSPYLLADSNAGDNFNNTGTSLLDILSNGFKLKDGLAWGNATSGTYIFAAFAEAPFKYSLAR